MRDTRRAPERTGALGLEAAAWAAGGAAVGGVGAWLGLDAMNRRVVEQRYRQRWTENVDRLATENENRLATEMRNYENWLKDDVVKSFQLKNFELERENAELQEILKDIQIMPPHEPTLDPAEYENKLYILRRDLEVSKNYRSRYEREWWKNEAQNEWCVNHRIPAMTDEWYNAWLEERDREKQAYLDANKVHWPRPLSTAHSTTPALSTAHSTTPALSTAGYRRGSA